MARLQERVSRAEPQFYEAWALPWERLRGPELVHGVDARVLSRDSGTESGTYVLRVPPDWRARMPVDEATLDLFVLEGDLALDGAGVGAGGYVFAARGADAGELRSAGGAQLVLFWNPQLAAPAEAQVRVTRVWEERWEQMEMPNSAHGAMHKSLRLPDSWDGPVHGTETGLMRMVLMTPGYADPRPHVHESWEEMLFLGGDLLMWDRGVIAPGTYLGNPGGFWHAPMISQRGALMLLQTVEPIDMVTGHVDGGAEVAAGYRDTESWIAPPTHREWDALPDYRR